ncbi:heavy-metal-associated domain-containing protein [Sphingobacterium thalpophilum]|uniref:heavy-metal-associated domain-containing protein n=1 Tax=Sphingobacterium TaxID=28453 RepID=UPI002243FFB4|nr:heavy-metal-associated domain-containing protein [Sphingobacterium sp. InxBP1]MCW8311854.1 heavy-metal-associated domain-containing protein [Sphingobacterium sp. InxBP1]
MKNIVLSIPDMQSTHCQTRVSNVIQQLQNVRIEKLEAGLLTFSAENDEIEAEVIAAIEEAGYKVDGGNSSKTSTCSTGCCG